VSVLKKDLGRVLRAEEVAKHLGLDVKTVRLYHRELGGMRLGRSILFFERRVADAIQNRTEVESPSAKTGHEARENLSDQEGSDRVGGRTKTPSSRSLAERDRHSILDLV
jgi:hypothetical protein